MPGTKGDDACATARHTQLEPDGGDADHEKAADVYAVRAPETESDDSATEREPEPEPEPEPKPESKAAYRPSFPRSIRVPAVIRRLPCGVPRCYWEAGTACESCHRPLCYVHRRRWRRADRAPTVDLCAPCRERQKLGERSRSTMWWHFLLPLVLVAAMAFLFLAASTGRRA